MRARTKIARLDRGGRALRRGLGSLAAPCACEPQLGSGRTHPPRRADARALLCRHHGRYLHARPAHSSARYLGADQAQDPEVRRTSFCAALDDPVRNCLLWTRFSEHQRRADVRVAPPLTIALGNERDLMTLARL